MVVFTQTLSLNFCIRSMQTNNGNQSRGRGGGVICPKTNKQPADRAKCSNVYSFTYQVFKMAVAYIHYLQRSRMSHSFESYRSNIRYLSFDKFPLGTNMCTNCVCSCVRQFSPFHRIHHHHSVRFTQ